MSIIDFITIPLGRLLNFIYGFVGNYGWTLIIFTALVKLILLPLSVKQQKSMIKMQQVQPLLSALQEKYKNDPTKQQEEMMKLYKENNVNPAGGCLPLLIQMPILIALYYAISFPLKFMFGMDPNGITEAVKGVGLDPNAVDKSFLQLSAAQKSGLINFNFLGLDLSVKPEIAKPGIIWIIPALAGITTYLSSKITSMQTNKKDKKEEENKKTQRVLNPEAKQQPNSDPQSMTNSMSIVMPFITVLISFNCAAALGFYWTVSNILSMIQQLYLNFKYGAKYKEEMQEKVKEKEQLQKEKRRLKQKRRNK
ncbi:MAG: YidC/Oxa1 family membrane protein insertase [Ruminococcaceae bacterium]|nr:YidC/Oxa1 family membrane protein insertase [Oscillospiraceae bacterium]